MRVVKNIENLNKIEIIKGIGRKEFTKFKQRKLRKEVRKELRHLQRKNK